MFKRAQYVIDAQAIFKLQEKEKWRGTFHTYTERHAICSHMLTPGFMSQLFKLDMCVYSISYTSHQLKHILYENTYNFVYTYAFEY